jgi:hypothetical protein
MPVFYIVAVFMKIKNIDGLSASDLQQEADQGARFVYFQYVISIIAFTFRKTSGVYLIKKGESVSKRAMPFTIISLLFGWWGIPSGPKYTLESIQVNQKGGKDVTDEVMATVAGHLLFQEAQQMKKVQSA